VIPIREAERSTYLLALRRLSEQAGSQTPIAMVV
jgi:hypothetical protein